MRPTGRKQSYKSHRILSISLPLPISRPQTETETETETSFDLKPVMISGSPTSLFRSLRRICMDYFVLVGRRWHLQASLCKQLVYHPLSKDEADDEKDPFGALLETNRKKRGWREDGGQRVIFIGVNVILFEHMLWLMYNDCSFFRLDLDEIIDFYVQDS
ncbi:hypothetical protein ACLOJK_023766 [Asimina triloba]